MTAERKQPQSARMLGQWVDAYARERGLAPKRVRDWVSYMVLAGRLEQANEESAEATFTIKGAVALEMRLPASARATKDIDVIAESEDERGLADVLEQALAEDYQGFAFRIKDDPYVMPNGSVRFQVALDYRGRSWSTVQVDLSRGKATRRRSSSSIRSPSSRSGSTRHRRCPAYHCATTWRRRSTG